LKAKYGERFSTVHWIDVKAGGRRVFGPQDGSGYVYCDGTGGVPLLKFENGCEGKDHRAVIMTYPIFETDRGTVVDFKNGDWEKGAYTGRPMKFVNFAAQPPQHLLRGDECGQELSGCHGFERGP
jgi:hypothetical protein